MSRASRIKPLSDTEIKKAKPKDKLYRLYDGGGLCLRVLSSGKKTWEYRFKNPATRKDDTIVIGEYPSITLALARAKHQELRSKVIQGINPKLSEDDDQLFLSFFDFWWERWKEEKTEKYANQVHRAVHNNCMDTLGHLNINDIEPHHIAKSLQPFEDRGKIEYLHRTKSALNLMFSFAVARGYCKYNPAAMVSRSAFKKHTAKNHKSLHPTKIYQLHEFFELSGASPVTKKVIEFILRNTLRLQEACEATWSELDGDLFTIPSYRMKMRKDHIVPLSSQSLKILEDMKKINIESRYIFESGDGHINKETPRIAVQRYGLDTTIHGFRHLASTILNDSLLFDHDVIEMTLAHQDKNQIRATYNKAQYIEKRRELLQWWSDFIDECDTEENNLKALEKYNIFVG